VRRAALKYPATRNRKTTTAMLNPNHNAKKVIVMTDGPESVLMLTESGQCEKTEQLRVVNYAAVQQGSCRR